MWLLYTVHGEQFNECTCVEYLILFIRCHLLRMRQCLSVKCSCFGRMLKWVIVHVIKASGHTHKNTHAGGVGTLHCLWAVAWWGRQFGWWPCLSLLLPLCPSGSPCWDLGLGQRTDCNFNLFSCGTETWGPEPQWKITSARAKIATTEYDTALKYTGHFASNRERKRYSTFKAAEIEKRPAVW